MGELRGLQRSITASPAWQQASSVWVIVGDDGASGDNGVFALTSLSSGVLTVQCGYRLMG